MDDRKRKVCPVCSREIYGRTDKKFCSADCRIYFHNIEYRNKNKWVAKDKDLATIYSTTLLLYEQNSRFLLNFILAAAKICKIFYTFGSFISKKRLHHDKSCFCIIFIVVGFTDFMC